MNKKQFPLGFAFLLCFLLYHTKNKKALPKPKKSIIKGQTVFSKKVNTIEIFSKMEVNKGYSLYSMKLNDFFNDEPPKVVEVSDQVLYIILEVFSTAYSERFKRLRFNPDDILFTDSLKTITNGDLITASKMLIDIHEILNIPMDYVPGNEYELFPTIKHIIDYFSVRFQTLHVNPSN